MEDNVHDMLVMDDLEVHLVTILRARGWRKGQGCAGSRG